MLETHLIPTSGNESLGYILALWFRRIRFISQATGAGLAALPEQSLVGQIVSGPAYRPRRDLLGVLMAGVFQKAMRLVMFLQ